MSKNISKKNPFSLEVKSSFKTSKITNQNPTSRFGVVKHNFDKNSSLHKIPPSKGFNSLQIKLNEPLTKQNSDKIALSKTLDPFSLEKKVFISRFKPLHQFYLQKNRETLLIRRIFQKTFSYEESKLPRAYYKFLFKYKTTLNYEVRKSEYSYSPSLQKDKYTNPTAGDHHIFSSLINNLDFQVFSENLQKEYLNKKINSLKKLKNVRILSITLQNADDLLWISHLSKRWRKIRNLFINMMSPWKRNNWRHLLLLLNESIDSLSITTEIHRENVSGKEFENFVHKFGECKIRQLHLTLDLSDEITLLYFFKQDIYFQHLTSLSLRCNGLFLQTIDGVISYQFCKLVPEIVPQIVTKMKGLQKLSLDFSNEVFTSYEVKDSEIIVLCQTLQGLSNVRDLTLILYNTCERGNYISDKAVDSMLSLFEKLEKLKRANFDFSNTCITQRGVNKIITRMASMKSLVYFRLFATTNDVKETDIEESILEFRTKSNAIHHLFV